MKTRKRKEIGSCKKELGTEKGGNRNIIKGIGGTKIANVKDESTGRRKPGRKFKAKGGNRIELEKKYFCKDTVCTFSMSRVSMKAKKKKLVTY